MLDAGKFEKCPSSVLGSFTKPFFLFSKSENAKIGVSADCKAKIGLVPTLPENPGAFAKYRQQLSSRAIVKVYSVPSIWIFTTVLPAGAREIGISQLFEQISAKV